LADVQAANFRGTGKLDLVVAVFGLQAAGEVILLENHTTDWDKPKFVPRQVDARHGAIHVPVADLDGDGKPDFVALFAQEHEAVVAFLNDGRGGFRSEMLYRAPHPAYGSSGIELVDLNGDGKLDVLYSNGDILDEPFLLKGYHSVQWLENKGGLKFEHHAISPMYGVHRAVAGDVLGNGRKDVVAVSFLPHDKFPDRATRQADAVVVFEQTADGRFARHPLLTVDCDSVVCVVGDLYGTGRQDIVVGNFSSPKSDHPVTIWRNAGKTGGR
jgi:FG-GAP-like repeat